MRVVMDSAVSVSSPGVRDPLSCWTTLDTEAIALHEGCEPDMYLSSWSFARTAATLHHSADVTWQGHGDRCERR